MKTCGDGKKMRTIVNGRGGAHAWRHAAWAGNQNWDTGGNIIG